jgi:serine protease DegS
MQLRNKILFILQFATLGLAAAFIIIILNPDILQKQRPVVEIKQLTPNGVEKTVSHGHATAPFSYSAAVKQAAPAVVNVYTAKVLEKKTESPEDIIRHFFNGTAPNNKPRIETSLGSGVIMTGQGHVITNYHVIADASEIQVMLSDGRSAKATLVGNDPETDLAILKINLENLPSITLGNSGALEVGDVVLAIGNPFGVGQTVTQGIISATGRKRLGLNTFENFIQTDAAINPGNSGGALINPRGEMIGINSAIFSKSGGSQGIGFAIPVNLARDVMTQIIENGHVVRGWLGIRMTDLTPALAKKLGYELPMPTGVVITALFEDSPALIAGLKPGDLLLSVNGEKVYDTRSILDLVSRQKPGTRIRIQGLHEGKAFDVEVQVAQRPVVTYRNIRR